MSDATALRGTPLAGAASAVGRAMTWLKGRERAGLFVAVAVQVVALVAMATSHAMPLLYGESVLVRVVPIDPRDFFRGEYVILSYDFSRVPPEGIEGLPLHHAYSDSWEQQGRTVYTSLVPDADGRHWRAEKISVEPPDDGVYLRGRIAGWNRIAYGIEAYYLQEGRGSDYEQAIRDGKVSAEIAVGPGGRAALRGLTVDRRPEGTAAGTGL